MTAPGPDAATLAAMAHLCEVINDRRAIIYIRDDAGRYVWVSDTYAQQLHLPRERVIGKTNRELYGPVAAKTWEVADSFARLSTDFVCTAETLFDTQTKRWRKFISTKLMVTFAGLPFLAGISVELLPPLSVAYEEQLGAIRAELIALLGRADVHDGA